MPHRRDRPARRRLQLFGAAIAAALLCLALALPTLATVRATRLDHATVTPRTGTTATVITFRVSYRSDTGAAPDYVQVIVGTQAYPMTASSTRWTIGVDYTAHARLPEGTLEVTFEARNGLGFVAQLGGGAVTIGSQAGSSPKPGTSDPPAPTQHPLTTPAVGGSTGGTPPSPGGPSGERPSGGTTPASTDGKVTAPTAHAEAPALPKSGAAGVGLGQTNKVSGSAASGGDVPSQVVPTQARNIRVGVDDGAAPVDARGPALGVTTATTAVSAAARGDGSDGGLRPPLASTFDRGMTALGIGSPGTLPTLPAMVTSSVAVATWMGFLLFNKRRRDEEAAAPDAILSTRAATGIDFSAATRPGDPADPEANLPRWLRPSLREARRIDPLRTQVRPAEPMAFVAGPWAAGEVLVERRRVRYAVAALLAQPDEVRAARIGEVAAGDEVQVEGRSGPWYEVVCPDGRRGWIHRTALTEASPGAPRSRTPNGYEPSPDGENALAALLAARGLQRNAT